MEALELLKTWRRICAEAEDCDNCPVPCTPHWAAEKDRPEDPQVKAIIDNLGSIAHLFDGKEDKVSSI